MIGWLLVLSLAAQPTDSPSPAVIGLNCYSILDHKHVARRLNVSLANSTWEDQDGRWYQMADISPTQIILANLRNEQGGKFIKLDRVSLSLIENTYLPGTNQIISFGYDCRVVPEIDMTAGRKF